MGAGRFRGGGEAFGGLDGGGQRLGGGDGSGGLEAERRFQAVLQPVEEGLQRWGLLGHGAAQAGDARGRARAAQAQGFQRAGCLAAGRRRQAGGGERVLQQRQQRDRATGGPRTARTSRRRKTDGGVAARRLAGAVVGDDAEAQQRGGDAFGQAAVGGDQRRARARRLQRITQGQGDGLRLMLLVGGGQAGQSVEDDGRAVHPVGEGLGGKQGAGEQAEAVSVTRRTHSYPPVMARLDRAIPCLRGGRWPGQAGP